MLWVFYIQNGHIPDWSLLRVCVCVCVCVFVCLCVCGCYARDTAWGIPFLLVSRETALFRQAILRVLTKKHGCTRLYSVQSSDVWLYPKPRVSDTTTCVWLDGVDACGYIHCLFIKGIVLQFISKYIFPCFPPCDVVHLTPLRCGTLLPPCDKLTSKAEEIAVWLTFLPSHSHDAEVDIWSYKFRRPSFI